MTQTLDIVAKRLAELGHPTRLGIFRLLVQAGSGGLPVGEVQQRLGIPASTLSHHLARLVQADLIVQQRDKNTLLCQPCFGVLQDTLAFLMEQCCQGAADCGVEDCGVEAQPLNSACTSGLL